MTTLADSDVRLRAATPPMLIPGPLPRLAGVSEDFDVLWFLALMQSREEATWGCRPFGTTNSVPLPAGSKGWW